MIVRRGIVIWEAMIPRRMLCMQNMLPRNDSSFKSVLVVMKMVIPVGFEPVTALLCIYNMLRGFQIA